MNAGCRDVTEAVAAVLVLSRHGPKDRVRSVLPELLANDAVHLADIMAPILQRSLQGSGILIAGRRRCIAIQVYGASGKQVCQECRCLRRSCLV